MNSFAELMRLRRSMRKFTDEPLDADDVTTLMRAALMSPTSKGLHSWQFVVVDDADMLRNLSQCKQQGADFLAGAPLCVVVAADPEVSDVWIEDASVAATVLLYQAEDLGLGACWIQIRDRYAEDGTSAEETVKTLLGMPDGLRVVSIVAIGHKGMERKPFNEDRLLWERVSVYSPLFKA